MTAAVACMRAVPPIALLSQKTSPAALLPRYLSRLRRDSVGADFQSVRKLTNYICAKPPESRLSHFHNVYYALQQYLYYGGYGY
jgi:hypothetical protein